MRHSYLLNFNQINNLITCEFFKYIQEHIRITYKGKPSLGVILRPMRIQHPCPKDCISCKCAAIKGKCMWKNAVYLIKCSTCDAMYIGETERTVRSRIIEHTKQTTSHVFSHCRQTHPVVSDVNFTWSILNTERNYYNRKLLESLYISKFKKEGKMLLNVQDTAMALNDLFL